MLALGINSEIDSVDGIAVEYPEWCPLLHNTVVQKKIPEFKIENFVKDFTNRAFDMMVFMTDGEPDNIIDTPFKDFMTQDYRDKQIEFAEDLLEGKIYNHFTFQLFVNDNTRELVFKINPRHIMAKTFLEMVYNEE